ncbi:MAG: hypothetical protein A3J29_10420 [Acidobacteria bacterium RIFCSPLOWO2_12_FULL_67_14b]|nr:MAG: hypothetical protein A3J29_10420 [Acidobacteria bacterium RIFCSPLOWO2_12_FULL_67_14b]
MRSLLFECLGNIRQGFRTRLEEDIASARLLLHNHEKEQVREVLRSAAGMLGTWVAQNSGVPPLNGHVQDSLLSQIHAVYASTVRATIRREGEWPNLSYSHHLGYGARRLAARALEPLVEKLKIATELMEANPEYAEAKDLIQQARRVLESAFEDLLRKAQIMGQTAFRDALKLDPSLWLNCEDSTRNTAHYWFLWDLFSERVKRAKWVAHLDSEHPSGDEMLSTIFLTKWWKDDVRHWRSLEGYAHHVDALFEALPPTSIVLDDYVRFLYHIGERSLPEAFVRVADSLRRGDTQAMLRKTNTVFLLEVLLQRHVYGRPLELKRDPAIRQAVLFLLDTLVENGSSAAFRMRDDFVTPAG